MRKLFLSHRLDILASQLSEQIATDGLKPLTRRTILVPDASFKQWLLLSLASKEREKGIAGCKIYTVREGLRALLPLSRPSDGFTEIFCALFLELARCTDPKITTYLSQSEKRRVDLSDRLAHLFSRYGEWDQNLFSNVSGWQRELLEKLFIQGNLQLPIQTLGQEVFSLHPIHCFGLDLLPSVYWETLLSFPSVSVYLFSPCQQYWGDLCSDRERRGLDRFWKERGASELKREELDAYLSEAPSLLANWGRAGRSAFKILDRYDWEINEAYLDEERDTSLGRLQKRLLDFEPVGETLFSPDSSVQLSKAGSSRLKEVEHLRLSILKLIEEEGLHCSEIVVLAPDIQAYIPLIEFVFSNIPYRIGDFEIGRKSFFAQGMHRFFDLLGEDWRADDLLALFENPSFCKGSKWNEKELEAIRDFLMKQKGKQIREEELLEQYIYLFPHETWKKELSSTEEVEKWIGFLQEIRTDLSAFRKARSLSLWAEWLSQWAIKYFLVNELDEADSAAMEFFNKILWELKQIEAKGCEELFPFAPIRKLLSQPIFGGQIHSNHLHAIRFGSIRKGSIVPAKALFLIGMDEMSFPRQRAISSLDILSKEASIEIQDEDRYLLLHALFAAREFLHISYCHLSPDEGKPVNPSCLVQELTRSLDAPISMNEISKPTDFRFPAPLFSWPVSPELNLPSGELFVSLADLTALVKHPWSFYIQKKQGIYIEQPFEESFSLLKARLLRASLKMPLEEALLAYRDELPRGICGEACKMDVDKEAKNWTKQLEEWQAEISNLTLRSSCRKTRQTAKGWEMPPLEFALNETLRVKVTGSIQTFSPKGFVHTGADTIAGLLRVWPECLVACIASGSREVHFLKSERIRTLLNPEAALQDLLKYYFFALTAPSPLLADWADSLLRQNPGEWEKEFQDRMGGIGTSHDDPVFDWALGRRCLPDPKSWAGYWSDPLKSCFAGLSALYPTRSQNALL